MKFYVDASVIVSIIVPESSSEASRRWLEAQETGTMVISVWVETELSSALALKVGTGEISRDAMLQALGLFRNSLLPGMVCHDVVASDFKLAQTYLESGEHTLRAGDAMHLAIAARLGVAIATNDRKLLDTAKALLLEFAAPSKM